MVKRTETQTDREREGEREGRGEGIEREREGDGQTDKTGGQQTAISLYFSVSCPSATASHRCSFRHI